MGLTESPEVGDSRRPPSATAGADFQAVGGRIAQRAEYTRFDPVVSYFTTKPPQTAWDSAGVLPEASKEPSAREDGMDATFLTRQDNSDHRCKSDHAGALEGVGGMIVRDVYRSTGNSALLRRRMRGRNAAAAAQKEADIFADKAPLPALPHHAAKVSLPWAEAGLGVGTMTSLAMCDGSPAPTRDVADVERHRWTFDGAAELAGRSRGYCFFVRGLLELQRNVQLEDGSGAFQSSLTRSCSAFVRGKCLEGRAGDMFGMLTHFLSNAVVFVEWARFLTRAFEDPRSSSGEFLVPHLEEVWRRFRVLWHALEQMFAQLDAVFVPLHRLPTVKELVKEHMRRRCFNSEAFLKNDLIARERPVHPVLQEVKGILDLMSGYRP